MTDTLQALISDLEGATAPDRMLDVRVECLVTGKPANADFHRYVERHGVPATFPLFTGSVDVALWLVPPGAAATVSRDPGGTGHAIVTVDRRPVEAEGATPAIALCIASLKARNSDV